MTPERRHHPRFRLQTAITAAIETEGTRYTGSIHDLSVDGFSLPDASQLYRHAPAKGEPAVIDLLFGNRLVKVSGKLVRTDPDNLGIHLDQQLDAELFGDIVKNSGAVQWGESSVHVVGAFNATVLRPLMQAVREGKMVDLSKVTWMDSSGLGIAMLALERGASIKACAASVRTLMAAGGVCQKCLSCKHLTNPAYH